MNRMPPSSLAILVFVALPVFLFPVQVSAQASGSVTLSQFKMLASSSVETNARSISSGNLDTANWYTANVPTTVLGVLVDEGVYPSPYFGMNNMRIPDASDRFNKKYGLTGFNHFGDRNPWREPYWFRTEFEINPEMEGREIWLNLKGINYQAEVWINGNRVADKSQVAGMFGSFRTRVTPFLNPTGSDVLALLVYPPEEPGMPAPPQLEALGPFGPNGGDCRVAKSVTMHATMGWDWIPAVRDRNMGIWQEVTLESTGPIDLENPRIQTTLPLPDTLTAAIRLQVSLTNTKTAAQSGRLKVTILPPDETPSTPIVLEQDITIEAESSTIGYFAPDDYPALTIQKPWLWWPTGYGNQPLYTAVFEFYPDGSGRSDVNRERFGIREMASRVVYLDGNARRDFLVNGVPIEIRGGAWVPDLMLRRDAQRYRDEVRLSHAANLNMIRIWGGGVTPPDSFFDETDRLGILVWHDFWITGDCQETWGNGSRKWPTDADVFLDNALDVVYRLRNRASLLVWTGGNEGYTRRQIYASLRNGAVAHADGTRPFLPNSSRLLPPKTWGWSWPDNERSGVDTGGPYHWVEPAEYFKYARERDDWLFKDEVGIPSLPEMESLVHFLPDSTHAPNRPFPLNDTWGYHDAASGNGKYELYHRAIENRYGKAQSLRDYTRKAQLLNYESHRAVFEAVNGELERTSGLLLWKTNSAWPSVMWQLYDWYLRPNASLFASQRASEVKHVQWNAETGDVVFVNRHRTNTTRITVEARVLSRNMTETVRRFATADVGPATAMSLFPLPEALATKVGTHFLKLTAREGDRIVSENLYWLHEKNNFSDLNELVTAPATTRIDSIHTDDDETQLTLHLENTSETISFFNRLRLLTGQTEILPAFWSDNYVTLLPGESRIITVMYSNKHRNGTPVVVSVSGWNQPAQLVSATSG